MDTEQTIKELGRRWAAAEVAGDSAELETLSAEDLRLVGPVGFVLDREEWAHRYDDADGLRLTVLDWSEVTVRDHGSFAIAIGVQDQQGTFHGQPVNGSFRVTQIWSRDGEDWRLAGLHYSPIGGPPPFAR